MRQHQVGSSRIMLFDLAKSFGFFLHVSFSVILNWLMDKGVATISFNRSKANVS